ncbi:MAG: ABC-F family ATP-binding cassette domain-containing protein [Deltaproteobacteria bacterium]|nr:ABC-F family ATP-binding cassette domain-containing protein [Deltaproteobacteria bacterium]
MISLSDVAMGFGARMLFEEVNWRLNPGVHYGLTGANGAGKSTLIKILSGELRPDKGEVSRPSDLRLGVLAQDQTRYDTQTLLQVVMQGRPALWAALGEKERLLAEGDSGNHDQFGHRLGELEAVIADHDGYTAEPQAARLLAGLGLSEERHGRPMGELSGGYRLRVLLAQTLFSEADLLLLDEPTNHLDIVSIRWLEEFLRAFKGTLVVISHDRHFLNAVCGHVADLDYNTLTLYPGNYDAFLAFQEGEQERKEAILERTQKKIETTQRFITRFKAKASKARQAGSRQKMMEKMEASLPVIEISSRRFPKFRFQQTRPSGKEALAAKGVAKSYGGHPVIPPLSFSVNRGERVAVVGPNGAGKSTLLKMIVGEVTPDQGGMIPGHEVRVGYFGQDAQTKLTGRTSLAEWLHGQAPSETVSTIRSILGRVLFSGDEADKPISALSGGEAARLHLARLMLSRDNLLVLDEPTNHLDLEARQSLLEALEEYEGTLIFVSHDRHFVSSLGKRVLALEGGKVNDFHGSYEEYLARQHADYLDAAKAAQPTADSKNLTGKSAVGSQVKQTGGEGGKGKEQRKETRREEARLRQDMSRLEKEVAKLEGELAEVEKPFGDPDWYRTAAKEDMSRLEARRKTIQEQLEKKMKEWEKAGADMQKLGA